MSETVGTQARDWLPETYLDEINQMMSQGVNAVVTAGAENLSLWCKLGDSWLYRRTEDLRTGAEAMHRISICSDPGEALQLSNEWLAERCQQLVEEASDYPRQLQSVHAQGLEALVASYNGLLSLTGAASRTLAGEAPTIAADETLAKAAE